METHARSIIKAATWRLGGLVMTFAVALMVTGRLGLAVSIGLADTGLKLGAYYVHERLWLRIRFGQRPPVEYEI